MSEEKKIEEEIIEEEEEESEVLNGQPIEEGPEQEPTEPESEDVYTSESHGIINAEKREEANRLMDASEWKEKDFQFYKEFMLYRLAKLPDQDDGLRDSLDQIQNSFGKRGITLTNKMLEDLYTKPQTFKFKTHQHSLNKMLPENQELVKAILESYKVLISIMRDLKPDARLIERHAINSFGNIKGMAEELDVKDTEIVERILDTEKAVAEHDKTKEENVLHEEEHKEGDKRLEKVKGLFVREIGAYKKRQNRDMSFFKDESDRIISNHKTHISDLDELMKEINIPNTPNNESSPFEEETTPYIPIPATNTPSEPILTTTEGKPIRPKTQELFEYVKKNCVGLEGSKGKMQILKDHKIPTSTFSFSMKELTDTGAVKFHKVNGTPFYYV